MAYVGQFVDGGIPTATELNTPLAVCLLRATTTQTFAATTTTAIQFGTGTTVRDSLNWHNEATNNTRITVSLAGMYRFTGTVACSGDMGTGGYLMLRKNGGTVLVREANDWRQTTNTSAGLAIVCLLAANDYVELLVNNSSATGRTRTFAAFSATFLGV